MLRAAAILAVLFLGLAGLAPEIALVAADRSPLARDLPEGEELRTVLANCQITPEFGFEAVLCPQELGPTEFSPALHAALIASEDRRFLSHGGVDSIAVFRAALGAVRLKEESGGSTITQQLARILLLERSSRYERKLKEWILARRIEDVAAKEEILARYMNVAPLGHGLFGFEAGARYYLGKSARDLSVMEAALLVSMLPRPVRDPVAAPMATYRATVDRIGLMRDQGFVTPEEAKEAEIDAKFQILGRRLPQISAAARAAARRPFEHRRVRDLALKQLDEAGLPREGARRLVVTLDPRFQRWADAAAAASPPGYEASALFMSPAGDVLAIGGPSYGSVQYNAAFEARRSIGSLGKVPLYVLAQEQPDLLRRRYSTDPIDGYSPHEPSAWCRGEVTLVDALAHSCNRPFARLAVDLKDRGNDFVAAAGLYPPQNAVLTPLGGVHGNLLAVTGMFVSIANGGLLVEPRVLLAAVDRDGKMGAIERHAPRRIIDREVATKVAIDLRAPVTRKGGTAHLAASPSRSAHVAGKTGTSDGNRDAWFVGFTQDFVGGIWAYATEPVMQPVAGGGYPAAQFSKVVDRYWIPKNAAAARPAPGFRETPQGAAYGWNEVRTRHLLQEVSRLLASLGLVILAGVLAFPQAALRWSRLRAYRLALDARGRVPPDVLVANGHRP
ncbi:transglycosylase domain-containing protein [Lutibaculum baratangense]|uniref:peptidoglycan glycosyltransferase n=1 Tax=Lutibaculum baratangense AMV1 TaxID=631454 RepID=V4T9Z6_9HYPH|nr:transglycosylase domain-containing protein [Lutibaculum baratangense]ESR23313.1 Multimodular transpeptidase-transglycosylase [Lutibaculum baratangense AMV1]